jgi:OOP family OmpA-OmpF porin
MKKINKFLKSAVLVFLYAAFAACSSVEKADIPSTANPPEEVTKFEEDMNRAVSENVDVLARTEYKRASKMLDESKSDLSAGQNQEEILDDVRKGRGYLNEAHSIAAKLAEKVPALMNARQMAIQAGATRYPELKDQLQKADAVVSLNASDLSDLSAEKLAKMQQGYINLEANSVILNQLGEAKANLNGARKDGALKSTPVNYKKSELSIKTAELIIASNVRNPSAFKASVAEANSDAVYLNEVMSYVKQNKNISESAAVKMANQNRQINNLKTDMSVAASANAALQRDMQNKNNELAEDMAHQQRVSNRDIADKERSLLIMQKNIDDKNKDLSSVEATVEMQRALESARSQFTSDEAEAYQQGGSLVIRLKKINFVSGHSELPSSSLASLAKVSSVAKSLNASDIRIEGHTDSLGSVSQNKTISEKRADVVASYFKSNGFSDINVMSEGYGFQKPIATNKSKEGRAQNRRVDIVITPKVVQ